MNNLYSVAEVIDPAHILLSRKPEWTLAVTLLLTAFDVVVLAVVGPLAFRCTFILAAIPVTFSILAFAMLLSLAHMWAITLRTRNH
jgi:hypothetical protein